MPKCPKCGAEIDYLVADRLTHIYQDVSLNHTGDLEYGDYNEGSAENDEKEEFYCPECNALITSTYEGAIKFLKGKDKMVKP